MEKTDTYVMDDQAAGLFRVNRRAFTDPVCLEEERARVFGRCWLYVGHESEVPHAGDYIWRSVAGRPMILVRGDDNVIRVKREVMPGNLKGAVLEDFIRDAASTYYHQACTAKMGRDQMSVVDNNLKVYGIDNLRIADGSIMPRVTTGNTMAPCVIIGERAVEIIRAEHSL
jgi:choline dehydrogenase-like flavoprotein